VTSRGGLLFFDKRGSEDPTSFLEEVQRARRAFISREYGGVERSEQSGASVEPSSIH